MGCGASRAVADERYAVHPEPDWPDGAKTGAGAAAAAPAPAGTPAKKAAKKSARFGPAVEQSPGAPSSAPQPRARIAFEASAEDGPTREKGSPADYRDRGASVHGESKLARTESASQMIERMIETAPDGGTVFSADGAGRDGKKKKLSTAKSMHVKKRDSITDASAQSREASFLKGQSDGLLAAGAVAVEEQVFHEVVEVSSRVDAELAADPTKLGAAIASLAKFVPRFVVQSLELRVANPPLDGRRDSTAGSGNPSRALASLREDAGSSPTEGSMRSGRSQSPSDPLRRSGDSRRSGDDNSYRRDEGGSSFGNRRSSVERQNSSLQRRQGGSFSIGKNNDRSFRESSFARQQRRPSGSYGERRQSGTFGGDRRPSGSFRRPSGSFRRPSGSFAMRRASFGEGLGAGPSTFVQKAAAAKSFRRVGSRAPPGMGDGGPTSILDIESAVDVSDDRIAVVLFADISGFTALTSELSKKGAVGTEELTLVINRVFTSLIEVTSSWRGDVVKFAGDAMLVLFYDDEGGAVDDDEDEEDEESLRKTTLCACRCALQLISAVSNTDWLGNGDGEEVHMHGRHTRRDRPPHRRPPTPPPLPISLPLSGPPVDAHRDHERSRVQHGRRRSLLSVGDRRVRRADHATRAGDLRREARRVRPRA